MRTKDIFIWGSVLILVAIAVYIGGSMSLIQQGREAFFSVDIDDNGLVEIKSSSPYYYHGVYGAYAIFIDDKFDSYYTFYTMHTSSGGGLKYVYDKSIDLSPRLNPYNNNNIKIYYNFSSINSDNNDNYLDNDRFCGQLVRQFNDLKVYESQSLMITNYHLCSASVYRSTIRNEVPIGKWIDGVCYGKDVYTDTYTKEKDSNYCKFIQTSYEDYQSASEDEILKFKTWAYYERNVKFDQPIIEEPLDNSSHIMSYVYVIGVILLLSLAVIFFYGKGKKR